MWLRRSFAFSSLAPLVIACGNPTVKAAPDSGTYILPPDGGREDGLGDLLSDGGIRPERPPSLCTKVSQEIQLTTLPVGASVPTIRWTGQMYIVVYSERDAPGDAKILLLNPDGTPKGPPVALEETPDLSLLPFIVQHGTGFVVAWEERGATKSIRARALDGNGTFTSGVVNLATFQSAEARPVLSSSLAGLTLAYMDVDGARPVSKLLALDPVTLVPKTDPPPLFYGPPGGSTSHPYTFGDGSALVSVYTEIKATGNDMHFTLHDARLAVTTSTVLRSGDAPRQLGRIGKASFGYLATWEDVSTGSNEIYSARVSPTGDLLGTGLIQEDNSGDGNWSNIAWHDDVGAVVFYQFRFGKPNVFLSFIKENGERVGGRADFRVSDKPSEFSSRYPDIVWNGTDFAVVWSDGRSGIYQNYFARVTCPKEP